MTTERDLLREASILLKSDGGPGSPQYSCATRIDILLAAESSSVDLPALPEPSFTAYQTDATMRSIECRGYHGSDMVAYARAAIASRDARIAELEENSCTADEGGFHPCEALQEANATIAELEAAVKDLQRRLNNCALQGGRHAGMREKAESVVAAFKSAAGFKSSTEDEVAIMELHAMREALIDLQNRDTEALLDAKAAEIERLKGERR